MSRSTRREFLTSIGLGAEALAVSCRHQPAQITAPEMPAVPDTPWERPNVIVILTDDQGWGDLSMNGNTNLSTPNIDKLGEQGAVFQRLDLADSFPTNESSPAAPAATPRDRCRSASPTTMGSVRCSRR